MFKLFSYPLGSDTRPAMQSTVPAVQYTMQAPVLPSAPGYYLPNQVQYPNQYHVPPVITHTPPQYQPPAVPTNVCSNTNIGFVF